MAGILSNLRNTVILGIVLTIIMAAVVVSMTGNGMNVSGHEYGAFIMRWLHVLSGVMWVGLLYYFNFVQIPNMANIPDEQKPAIGKVIAPAALWWFRWAAMSTIVTGLLLATMNGYVIDALTLGAREGFAVDKSLAIGIGMWLGIIMWFNVWFVIWPKQKKALGLVEADAATKAAAARTAMLVSRANVVLSFPMLYAMVSAQNLY
ncbi:urate hydroxylase PuuD [Sneathiella sp.]|uniref:urate hydroxylase PuuD n=1 Tax=Sneathiella sp. TaxID=1964365 RepID=UPI003566F072